MNSFATSTEHLAATAALIDAMRPSRLAPLHRRCDLCDSGIGAQLAVIDAPTMLGPWGYLCLTHATTHCNKAALKIGTRLRAEPTIQADFHGEPYGSASSTQASNVVYDDSPLPLLNPDVVPESPTPLSDAYEVLALFEDDMPSVTELQDKLEAIIEDRVRAAIEAHENNR